MIHGHSENTEPFYTEHLEHPGAHARLLCRGFSSASNKMGVSGGKEVYYYPYYYGSRSQHLSTINSMLMLLAKLLA